MTNISKQTAMDIALAYREVESAEELLAKIGEELQRGRTPDIRDAFGRPARGLELGVPSGSSGHRLFDVQWELAKPIIEAHIAKKKAVIQALTVKAQAEINEPGF